MVILNVLREVEGVCRGAVKGLEKEVKGFAVEVLNQF